MAKTYSTSRSNRQHDDQPTSNVVKLNNKSYKRVELIPRNTRQEEYIEQLSEPSNRIVIATGSAGTGKTVLAVLAAIRELQSGTVEKIVITRPLVSVDEEVGILPGTILEKVYPYFASVLDIFEEFFGKVALEKMINDGIIIIQPLAMIRGRTFKNSIMLADEMQLATTNQTKAVLTRIGNGTRIFITGDLKQTDQGRDGLKDLLGRLEKTPSDSIKITKFGNEHIERDYIVGEVLRIYGE
jgi:phosphate starvation-inducible PhoH-like protein